MKKKHCSGSESTTCSFESFATNCRFPYKARETFPLMKESHLIETPMKNHIKKKREGIIYSFQLGFEKRFVIFTGEGWKEKKKNFPPISYQFLQNTLKKVKVLFGNR